MRVVCPSCEATYDVPDAMLGDRPRRLRCARCAHEWTVEHPPAAEHSPPPAFAAPESREWPDAPLERVPLGTAPGLDADEMETQPSERPRLRAAAWVLSLVIVAGGLAGAVIEREAVMQAWPPSARVLGLFGH